MNEVFVLRHTYGSTDEEEDENWKQLGAYSSLREAELAMQRFVKQQGFKDYPNGFVINSYELNRNTNGWEKGLVID